VADGSEKVLNFDWNLLSGIQCACC